MVFVVVPLARIATCTVLVVYAYIHCYEQEVEYENNIEAPNITFLKSKNEIVALRLLFTTLKIVFKVSLSSNE